MINFKLFSAGLLAAAMIASPVLARGGKTVVRQPAFNTDAGDSKPIYTDRGSCIPAPRVGAFATAPWSDTNVPCEPRPGYY